MSSVSNPPSSDNNDRVAAGPFDETLGWFACDSIGSHAADAGWIPRHRIRLPIDDLGFRQSVTAVERLRTYRGNLWQTERHGKRFAGSLAAIGMSPWTAEKWNRLLDELIRRNQSWVDAADVGITVLATPGRGSSDGPTEIAMIQPIDRERVVDRQTNGQTIVTTDIVQPSPQSWSRQAKLRCRVHYYLADIQARSKFDDATGLLIDVDGTITETSIANVAMVVDGEVYSPPIDRVLHGVTQSVVEDIAKECDLTWHRRPMEPAELRTADEVWLMGTDAGIWFSHRVDDTIVGDGKPGPLYRRVQEHFLKLAGSAV